MSDGVLRVQTPFTMVPTWIVRHRKLDAYAVRLYAVIGSYAHPDGTGAFPSMATLAEDCGCSVRMVQMVMRQLQDNDALAVRPRWRDGSGATYYEDGPGRSHTSNEYVLLAQPPEQQAKGVVQDVQDPPQDVREGGAQHAPGVVHDMHPNKSSSPSEKSDLNKTSSRAARGRTADGVEAAPRRRGTRLPDDWRPSSADVGYARDRGMTVSIVERTTQDFRDYWLAKAGKDAVKLDWSLTWQTWVRRECDRRGLRPTGARRQQMPSAWR